MKISIGCDHGGFQLKEAIKKHLTEKGIETVDVGAYSNDHVDYPSYAAQVGKQSLLVKAI